jgi:hypothetical protein
VFRAASGTSLRWPQCSQMASILAWTMTPAARFRQLWET